MMIGLDVAPVAPSARLRATSSGSTESSQSFVPQAIRDWSGVVMSGSGKQLGRRRRSGAVVRTGPSYFLRLYVIAIISLSLPSATRYILNSIVSLSVIVETDLNLAGLPSIPGPSPCCVRVLPSLSKSPSISNGDGLMLSIQIVKCFFLIGQ